MDTGNDVRVQDGIHFPTPSEKRTGSRQGEVPGTRRGVRKAHRKGGHRACRQPLSSNFHQPDVRRSQIGWLMEAGAKPQSACQSKTLQDGVNTDRKRPSTQRGLDGKARCFHSYAQLPSTISGLSLEGTPLEVQDTPLWPEQRPYIFTKLMKPVIAILRRLGIRAILYLDDLLIMAQSKEEAKRQR